MKVLLQHVAHCRSGAKGNTSAAAVVAYDAPPHPHLKEQLTAPRLKAFYAGVVAVAAATGIALAAYSAVTATQPHPERGTIALPAAAIVVDASAVPAFVMPTAVAASAEREAFEYY